MVKTRRQARNMTVKKEEEDDKSTLGLGNVHNTRSSGRIAKRKSPIINNIGLPAQQVKVEEDTDTKSLLQAPSKYPKRGPAPKISQEQINQLIRYIVNDNMSIGKASRKVNISVSSGWIYYKLYKDNPEKKIPVLRNRCMQTRKKCTQEQIENLIKYIHNDKMTVKEAAAKVSMSCGAGRYYHNRFLKNPNHTIPLARSHQYYTQDQKNEFIGYIINDKMSTAAASKKAKMNDGTARNYYHKYFEVQNPNITRPSHIVTRKRFTQVQIKEVISYIVDDKMSIAAASRKANMCQTSGQRCYRKYLKNHHLDALPRYIVQDQRNKLIGYIVDDKMSITSASKKANMSYLSSYRYYRKYLKKQKCDAAT